MDRFDALQAFARVVEAGSFTKAAQTLHMSKTTVTQLVQQLEARLRVKLLNRTTRQVKITPDGAVYYERVVRLLADLEDADTSLSSALASPKGRLRVDVPSPLARLILMPALPAFHERYPEIQFDMGVSDRMVDLIGDNVDCVLRGGELLDQSLVARRVANVSLITVASPAYLQAHGTPTHPEQLESGHTMVNHFSTRNGRHYVNEFEKDGQMLEISGRYKLSVNESNAITAAVLAGLGVAQMAAFTARPLIERGELVQVLSDWTCMTIPLYVVYPPNRHLSAKVRAFVEWVAELLARHPHMSG